MAGGFDRASTNLTRDRRMFQKMQAGVAGVEYGNGLVYDPDTAILTASLVVGGGLEFNGTAIQIDLDTNPGLVIGSGGLKIDLRDTTPGLELVASGIGVLLDPTTPGLQLTNGVKILLDTTPGLVLGAGGLKALLDPTNPGLQLTNGFKVLLDGSSLTLGALGLKVTASAGVWTVTAIKTANYNAASNEFVRCDPSAGGFTVTLPTAAGITGQSIVVKNVSSSVLIVTVAATGAETIDGSATALLTSARQAFTFVSDGTNWMIS